MGDKGFFSRLFDKKRKRKAEEQKKNLIITLSKLAKMIEELPETEKEYFSNLEQVKKSAWIVKQEIIPNALQQLEKTIELLKVREVLSASVSFFKAGEEIFEGIKDIAEDDFILQISWKTAKLQRIETMKRLIDGQNILGCREDYLYLSQQREKLEKSISIDLCLKDCHEKKNQLYEQIDALAQFDKDAADEFRKKLKNISKVYASKNINRCFDLKERLDFLSHRIAERIKRATFIYYKNGKNDDSQ